jgi:hypothetical protein
MSLVSTLKKVQEPIKKFTLLGLVCSLMVGLPKFASGYDHSVIIDLREEDGA